VPYEAIRVLITGSREFTDRAVMEAALHQVAGEWRDRRIIVVEGDARGADKLSAAVAQAAPETFDVERHPAQWRLPDGSTNKKAGFDRNQLMVDLSATVCLAFLQRGEKNSGTRDCMRRAEAAGIPVRAHWNTAAAA